MVQKNIIMPQLGESVTEGTVNTWLVKEGDFVNEYDPLVDVMTDKVNAEVPSTYTGTIKEIVVSEGETVKVGSLLGYIEVEDGEDEAEKHEEEIDEKESNETNDTTEQEASMANRYSPAVLRLSQEQGINLAEVKGTGLGGRITRKDILAFEKSDNKSVNQTKDVIKQSKQETSDDVSKEISYAHITSHETDIEIPVTPLRNAIAKNMVQSKQEIPHAWMTVEVDVTDLVNYRNDVKKEFKQSEGVNLTYFAFFVKVIANALKKFPELNSMWAGDKIIQKQDVNISIAVANEDELFVPVIQNADEMSIKGIAVQINELAQKAKRNKLTQTDISGGTFTINNTGTFGSISSMGIINHPQAAILQVESIVKRPVIINDMFAARDIVNLSLSLDHRILDGLVCGRFLAYIKERLESINEQTTNLF
ncbi:MAG TPA: dihydrolipoamide acetyltransferase family protein [Pseudogracilibacillus sp.]|nr:dihydrolipoamide acetyltransferase family protein [Pseudogracilibacillus sp.]